ncbi:uncharacterized protein CBL_01466 [Carabus blaptoides fortunei]
MAYNGIIIVVALLVASVAANPVQSIENKLKHPDVGLRVPQLVTKYGYPIESHIVETKDGYLLTVHRIPHGKNNADQKNKPVVFLMHGLLCSSADWVLMGPEKGLAYILADLGYDVWMGNARGNTYSRSNVNLSPTGKDFWKFSWHQIGIIDLPTMIDLVLEKSGAEKIFYVGHSQGTTSFFVMASTLPEYNDKIRLMVALAPVAFMDNIPNTALRLIAKFHNTIGWISDMIGAYEFLPSTKFMQLIGQLLCNDNSLVQDMCSNILFLIAGYDSEQLNSTMIPVILSNTPAGSSTMQILHFAQGITSGDFKQYDFGASENRKIYGRDEPPAYDLRQITARVVMYYGANDLLTSETDVSHLHKRLSKSILKYRVRHDLFSHLDFLWSNDVVPLLYKKVIDMMKRY